MTARIKPPMPYFGGKQRVASRIAALLPPHLHYVEPYAGGLSVLLAKSPVRFETVNDLDGDLMTFWRMLRDFPEDLERVCALTPHSRAEFEMAINLDVGDDLERARRVWVRLTQGRNSAIFRPTGWRQHQDPVAITSMPRYLAGYVGRMAPVAARLHGVSLECLPALDIIARYGKHTGVLLYVDPPYLSAVRPRSRDGYKHEMADTDHHQLLEALSACRAMVVISGYHSPIYDDVLKHWNTVELASITTQGNLTNTGRVEVLWSNLPFTEIGDVR